MEEYDRRKEAIAYYKKAIAIKPEQAEFYNQLGNCYQGWGNLAEAIACHQKAIALKPDFASAYNNLGLALQEQLKLQKAMGYYRYAIALKPDTARGHLSLGECLLLLQNFRQGFVEYEWHRRLKVEFFRAQTPEERWLLDRSDSPWYPTMRLFRQAKPGDWSSVFAQVKAALTAKSAPPGSRLRG